MNDVDEKMKAVYQYLSKCLQESMTLNTHLLNEIFRDDHDCVIKTIINGGGAGWISIDGLRTTDLCTINFSLHERAMVLEEEDYQWLWSYPSQMGEREPMRCLVIELNRTENLTSLHELYTEDLVKFSMYSTNSDVVKEFIDTLSESIDLMRM